MSRISESGCARIAGAGGGRGQGVVQCRGQSNNWSILTSHNVHNTKFLGPQCTHTPSLSLFSVYASLSHSYDPPAFIERIHFALRLVKSGPCTLPQIQRCPSFVRGPTFTPANPDQSAALIHTYYLQPNLPPQLIVFARLFLKLLGFLSIPIGNASKKG